MTIRDMVKPLPHAKKLDMHADILGHFFLSPRGAGGEPLQCGTCAGWARVQEQQAGGLAMSV